MFSAWLYPLLSLGSTILACLWLVMMPWVWRNTTHLYNTGWVRALAIVLWPLLLVWCWWDWQRTKKKRR